MTLVSAPVFKTGEASETMPGGFDSHPLPFFSLVSIPFVFAGVTSGSDH